MRYLKSTVNGSIHEWSERLAAHRNVEEITEEQAYPERFVKAEVIEQAPSKKRGRKPLSLSNDTPEEVSPNLALEADATRRLKVAS